MSICVRQINNFCIYFPKRTAHNYRFPYTAYRSTSTSHCHQIEICILYPKTVCVDIATIIHNLSIDRNSSTKDCVSVKTHPRLWFTKFVTVPPTNYDIQYNNVYKNRRSTDETESRKIKRKRNTQRRWRVVYFIGNSSHFLFTFLFFLILVLLIELNAHKMFSLSFFFIERSEQYKKTKILCSKNSPCAEEHFPSNFLFIHLELSCWWYFWLLTTHFTLLQRMRTCRHLNDIPCEYFIIIIYCQSFQFIKPVYRTEQ